MVRGQGHNVFLKDKDKKLINKGVCENTCPNGGFQVSDEHSYFSN